MLSYLCFNGAAKRVGTPLSAQPLQVPSSLHLDLVVPPFRLLRLCALCDLCGEYLSPHVTTRPPKALRPARCRHRVPPHYPLTPLQSALPKNAPVTLSESALTKWLNLKSFRIRTYEKTGGRGVHANVSSRDFHSGCFREELRGDSAYSWLHISP